jgi:hypothetical protein
MIGWNAWRGTWQADLEPLARARELAAVASRLDNWPLSIKQQQEMNQLSDARKSQSYKGSIVQAFPRVPTLKSWEDAVCSLSNFFCRSTRLSATWGLSWASSLQIL